MGLVIFGEKQTPVGLGEFMVKCPSCETQNLADIMVNSHYFHFFFLPFFPTDKDADVICKKCGLKRYGVSFDQQLISDYEIIKNQFRHPWFTYSGLAIIILIILLIIAGALF